MFGVITRMAALSDLFIGVTIATIVGVGVAIPVIQQTVLNANITGIAATILTYLPVFIAVVLLVALARNI